MDSLVQTVFRSPRKGSQQRTFSPHPINRWSQCLVYDLLHDSRCCHWGRRICTHSTCIGPRITLPDTFVVLCCWKWHDRVSIGECKDRDL